MSVKTKKRPAVVRAAFERFIELVRPIEGVEYVILPDSGPSDVYTYVSVRDEELWYRIYDAENEIIRSFPDVEIDFHVRFLNGRTLRHAEISAGLSFERESNG